MKFPEDGLTQARRERAEAAALEVDRLCYETIGHLTVCLVKGAVLVLGAIYAPVCLGIVVAVYFLNKMARHVESQG